jgi:hypothetical protein
VRNVSAEKGEKRVAQRFSAILLISFLCARIKKVNKRIIMKKILIAFMLICSVNAYTQTIDDPADGDGTVPVDGGISLLLAAGAGLAARKLLGQRQPVQSPPDGDE